MKLIMTLGPGLTSAAHGDVAVLDWDTKEIIDDYRYEHQIYEGSHKGLTGASWFGNRLMVATEGEVLELDVAPLRLVQSHTLRCLNDVHHVASTGDRIWICNTGMDSVEELNADWEPLATHDLVRAFGRRPRQVAHLARRSMTKAWARFRGYNKMYTHLTYRPRMANLVKIVLPGSYHRRDMDLRVCDFRPHVLHPNHVLPVGDDIWVTLWQTGEIASLRRGEILLQGLGNPHDGIPVGDRFYVTDCATNRVIVHEFDPSGPSIGPRVAQRVLTQRIQEGFVRGIAVGNDRLFVGMTARRAAPDAFRVARVVSMDPDTLEITEVWNVPERFGTGIFSLMDAGESYG